MRGPYPILECRAPLALAAFVVACGGATDEAADDWSVSIDTLASGAVRVVHTPPGGAIEPVWVVEEEVRIGTLDGSGPELFGQIHGLAAGDDGRIFVLDSQAQEVRVFGPDGSHLRTMGGPGAGPGELMGANGIVRAPDGRIWVVDPQLARVSVFDADGEFRTSYPYDRRCWTERWEGAFDSAGRVLEPCASPIDGQALLVYDPEMRFLDSIPTGPPGPSPTGPPGYYHYTGPTIWAFEPIPFHAHARSAIDPTPAFWSTTDGDQSYRLARWVPGGDTTLVIESRRPPVPVTAAERDSAIASIREILAEHGSDTRLDWSRIPGTRPAIGAIFLSDDGQVWVRATTPGTGTTTWDVFEVDGRLAGTAVAPFNAVPGVRPVVRGNRLWAAVTDEHGAEYVVGARLVAR